MNVKGFKTILLKRLREKWGRFALASGGIAVGIWAITLTTGLSLGLSGTIVDAINSQPSAKQFQIFKNEAGKTSFFEFEEGEKFVPMSLSEVESIKNDYPEISSLLPMGTMEMYLKLQENSCVSESSEVDTFSLEGGRNENCLVQYYTPSYFDSFYEENKSEWIGKTESLDRGEIAICYECGDNLELYKKLGVSSPEEMIGKTIELELYQSPDIYTSGKAIDFERDFPTRADSKAEIKSFEVVSVIDDRGENNIGFGSLNMYISYGEYLDKIKSDHNKDESEIYFTDYNGEVFQLEELDGVIDRLTDQGYLTFAPLLGIVKGVETFFNIITWVLAGFGMIALIASIFGIINIMTISVLERKKEIGILKSLGAKDRDIFWLFLTESSFLGVFGWIIGSLFAWGMGTGLAAIANSFIQSNDDWKDALEALNVDNLSPEFPVMLLVGTLALAIFFTALSGIVPARRAAKQNPVDVLRGE